MQQSHADTQTMAVTFEGTYSTSPLLSMKSMRVEPTPAYFVGALLDEPKLEASSAYMGETYRGTPIKVSVGKKIGYGVTILNVTNMSKPITKSVNVDVETARKLYESGKWRMKVVTTIADGQEQFILADEHMHLANILDPFDGLEAVYTATVVLHSLELTDVNGNTIVKLDNIPMDYSRYLRKEISY